jgi:hypothetical protein
MAGHATHAHDGATLIRRADQENYLVTPAGMPPFLARSLYDIWVRRRARHNVPAVMLRRTPRSAEVVMALPEGLRLCEGAFRPFLRLVEGCRRVQPRGPDWGLLLCLLGRRCSFWAAPHGAEAATAALYDLVCENLEPGRREVYSVESGEFYYLYRPDGTPVLPIIYR